MTDNIIKKPFEPQKLEEDRSSIKDTFTIRLNQEERQLLEEAKKILEQKKDSTCFKQLAFIGFANVRHDKKTALILQYLFKNKRNNKRNNIFDFD